jgi:hypothetical protein
MKNTTYKLLAIGFALMAYIAVTTAQTTTNALSQTVTTTNALSQIGGIPGRVASDGYLTLKSLSFTNPIQANLFGIQNGSGKYGVGLEINQAAPDSLVSVGFGVAAIQTDEQQGIGTKKTLSFYDATVNLGVGDVINFPGTSLPLTYRLFSGPFTKLNNSQGGVYVGEESGAVGEMNFVLSSHWGLGFGGGAINCSGAAAAGLKPAMPIAKLAFTWAPKGW